MASASKKDIYVYADWQGLNGPNLIGILGAHQAKGRKSFSFEYDSIWLKSGQGIFLDPELGRYQGTQFPVGKENFGVFSDAMPDTWGRKLMQRRAALVREPGETKRSLHEIDYLLGVHDVTRMGGLRFKLDKDGPFLDNDDHQPTPPWASIRELQHSATVFESDAEGHDKEWIELLLAPGSSLGGGRPKANIVDEAGELWIAKFPSSGDTIDKAAWEYLAYLLAGQCGLPMAESRLEHVHGKHRTFFTKRFDRHFKERIHFSSAMTMTGNHEELIRDAHPSYLEIAEFMQDHTTNPSDGLEQLWRRIVFNIAISNTDDHLRNHGFLLEENQWKLSPAYDLNPSIEKAGLGLNIDMDSNELDFDLARSVGDYFLLNPPQMDFIITQVQDGIANWRELANDLNIPRSEQEYMAPAFRPGQERSVRRGPRR